MVGEHFEALQSDCYMVSTTSRDYEFSLPDLRQRSTGVERLGRLGTRYRLEHGPTVVVLGHGMPINFHYAESLPNRSIDLVLASILVGACAIANGDPALTPGINVAPTNDALRDSGLLDEYYDLWKKGTVESDPTGSYVA